MNLEFRIWDKKYKYFSEYGEGRSVGPTVYFENLLLHQKGFLCLVGENKVHPANDGGFVVQQFTNALGKNNQQIFEGDIVLYENPDPYDNETLLVKIVGYNSRVMGFRLYNFSHEIDKSGGTSFFPEEVEVIGNIFEGASKDGVDYGKWLVEK